MTANRDVVVVGAGLAGLAAAGRLHRAGLDVVVCEADDDVGGRVRTDLVEGFRLDRGFQVLLPAYPELRRQADVAALLPRPFLRGLLAMTPGGRRLLAGPWHGLPAAAGAGEFVLRHGRGTAALGVLSARDLLAPASRLLGTDDRASIADELRRWRVDDGVVSEVLRPFLAGVFLDPDLGAPARLFDLIWRCMLRGGAALPAAGMQALPRQLAAALPDGAVRTGTAVAEVGPPGVRTANGEEIGARAVVVATDGTVAAGLLPELTAPGWHAVTTFYYRVPASPPSWPALIVDGLDELLLNTAVLSDVAPSYAPSGSALVTASVPGRAEASLEPAVRARLAAIYETATDDWDLLASYPIERALPVLAPGQPFRRPVRLGPARFVCGDHRDTPSIQGALVSGRRAAVAVLADLS
ncbi:MAG: NAD(P)/FAD-dependent oxidoreductase [Streptosporangiaceae bacterium]